MLIYLGKKATQWREREHRLDHMISLLSNNIRMIAEAIHCGFRSKQVYEIILSAAKENGSPHRYRLTITLDSLAGLEKTDAGMNTMEHTGGKGETEKIEAPTDKG